MWHVMVFANEAKTEVAKVISLGTIREVGYLLGEPAQTISNYYHKLIRPRGGLKYVAIFKG
eukprot:COSAG02_NODE_1464_length_12487_cov_122.573297_3_plen_61_part_00